MRTFWAFVKKEARHIIRDPRTTLILFGMPIAMMLIFGFAISTEVRNVRTIVVTSETDHLSQRIVDELGTSEYFTIVGTARSTTEAERQIRNQNADIALVFEPNFAAKMASGHPALQIITDATDPNMAQMYATYAQSIVMQNATSLSSGVSVNSKMLFNPQSKSAYNFVPGLMGMLLLLICAMMTSISIAREKETGTMEVLLVSPIKPIMIIIAKAVPYLVLAMVILAVILLLSYFVLDVPLAGSIFAIIGVSCLYILLSLSLGLLISTVANSQLVAMLISAMLLLLPCVMLSGMMFPIESMPTILQYITVIVPTRYYIEAMRTLMVMGSDTVYILDDILILSLMTIILLSLALLKFKKRLE